MTICLATDGFPPQVGGIATFNKHLVSLLTNAGHKVIVLYIDYTNNETDPVITEGPVTKILLGKTYHHYKKKWQPYFRPGGFDAPNWIAMGMAMRDWLLNNHRQFTIDIIEASDYGGIGIFLSDKSLPPVIITGHGCLFQFARYNYTRSDDHYKVISRLEQLSITHADSVIAHSPLNKNDLESFCQRKVELVTIPWINEAMPQLVPVVDNKLVVVGGLQPVKGANEMAAAMEQLAITSPESKLFWIGGDTWLAPRQQKMSGYLQQKYPGAWQQNFIWENEQPQGITQKHLASASLVIIPAIFETFNYVAPEAAALKKSILITDKAGAAYLFTHGEDAWIIPANDPAALAAAIIYLQNNPELCQEMGEKAFKKIEQSLLPGQIVSQRIAVYTAAIQNGRQRPTGLHPALSFLDTYHVFWRKQYYCIRAFLKKITGRK